MATVRQKLAAEKIVEKRGSVSAAMRAAGYTDASAKNPKNLTESKGFQELCDELGLTDEFLLSALVEDIKGKPGDRKPELELGFKVKGRMTEKKEITGKDGGAIAFVDMASDDGEG
ncbi:hypothetical protein [Pseudarthrobacter oxydans]|uniref:hypothetical protein n=1 Tax=Pseudarthrobacter oxydans TaxID=1671 RepID=UPI0035E8FE41|nr:hypothetical protein GCM10017547_38710 [Pseudarthrobacter oxydans]